MVDQSNKIIFDKEIKEGLGIPLKRFNTHQVGNKVEKSSASKKGG